MTAIQHVIGDVWTQDFMTRGMPDDTRFYYWVQPDEIAARLSTFSHDRHTHAVLPYRDLEEPTKLMAAVDRFLDGLRRAHHWPLAVEAKMQADPSWVAG